MSTNPVQEKLDQLVARRDQLIAEINQKETELHETIGGIATLVELFRQPVQPEAEESRNDSKAKAVPEPASDEN